jgi:sigma-B regulation protein RsbU (phosphoserine phosphatase)
MLLAVVEGVDCTDKALPMEPGDRLLLYTDGIVEARSAAGQIFGEASLFAALQQTAAQPPAEVADHIIVSEQQWARSQDDDLTVLVCDFMAAA